MGTRKYGLNWGEDRVLLKEQADRRTTRVHLRKSSLPITKPSWGPESNTLLLFNKNWESYARHGVSCPAFRHCFSQTAVRAWIRTAWGQKSLISEKVPKPWPKQEQSSGSAKTAKKLNGRLQYHKEPPGLEA